MHHHVFSALNLKHNYFLIHTTIILAQMLNQLYQRAIELIQSLTVTKKKFRIKSMLSIAKGMENKIAK